MRGNHACDDVMDETPAFASFMTRSDFCVRKMWEIGGDLVCVPGNLSSD
jgi:hypothetical protein